jgi:hypothetical protein
VLIFDLSNFISTVDSDNFKRLMFQRLVAVKTPCGNLLYFLSPTRGDCEIFLSTFKK